MIFSSDTPQRLFGSIENAPKEAAENHNNFNEITFGKEEYRQVWHTLTEAIGEREYYSGRVTTLHNGFASTLRTSLIIYRDKRDPERPIVDMVPIWWDIETITDEGENLLNDFELCELLKLVGEE